MTTSQPPDDSDLTPETPNADPVAQENALRAGDKTLQYDSTKPHDPYAALRLPNFRRYLLGQSVAVLGGQMMGATIGWELYQRTHSAAALGLIGLAQIIPFFALFLPAGYIVDRFNRKRLVLIAQFAQGVCAFLLAMVSLHNNDLPGGGALDWLNRGLDSFAHRMGDTRGQFHDRCIPLMFGILFMQAAARAIAQPARSSMLPAIIPPKIFPNAVTWNTTTFETCSITGPMLAGAAIFVVETYWPASPWKYSVIYFGTTFSALVTVCFFSLIEFHHVPRPREPISMRTLFAGITFIYKDKIIFSAVMLDMFAVLLGGATSLLPIYAQDILHAGPIGFAALRAAPSIGAILMSIYTAHSKPRQNPGRTLLICVAGFGVATIIFGLSTNIYLSVATLFFTGVFDNVSVVVRQSFVQILTPDAMRGRVSAANAVFIASSNELGTFESGYAASIGQNIFGSVIAGTVFSVVAGGVGSILVTVVIAAMYPQLRRTGRLEDLKPGTPQQSGP